VNSIGFANVISIDFMTVHSYPSHWGKDDNWVSQWINAHKSWADQVGKPVIMEEYGGTGSDSQKAAKLQLYGIFLLHFFSYFFFLIGIRLNWNRLNMMERIFG